MPEGMLFFRNGSFGALRLLRMTEVPETLSF